VNSTGKTAFRKSGAAISDAKSTGDDSGGFDSDLSRLVDAWPELDDQTRRQILEIAGIG
jgi:hypothetical protein